MDSSLTPYWNDLLSWGGTALLLVGMKLIGDKKFSGFIVSMVSRAMWIIWAVRMHAIPLVAMNLMLLVVYLHNIHKWRKSEQEEANRNTPV